MRRSRVRFYDDTLREMAEWAAKRYGLGSLRVAYRAQIKGGGSRTHNSGCTSLYEKSVPLIELNIRRTYRELIDVLAHELAHVLTWKRCGKTNHGPQFRVNLSRIVRAWNRHVG